MNTGFAWHRLITGIVVGGFVGILLSWLLAPELASRLALGHGYDGPSSADLSMLLLDLALSFAASFAGSYLSFRITQSHPYWSCIGPSILGWLYYLLESGGPVGMFATQFPWWYELAPSNLAAGMLAAVLISRRHGPSP